MAVWNKLTEGLAHGGYVAWEAALAEASATGPVDHVPVFVELKQPAGSVMTLAEAIMATQALPDLALSRHERDLLATELARAADADWTRKVRLVAFWPRAKLDALPLFWRELQVGPGMALPEAGPLMAAEDLTKTKGRLSKDVPLVAVIDDGIGFLNARFRKSRDRTRLKAVWLQAAERRADGPGPWGDVVCGRVLTGAEIDAHLTTGGEEAEIYRQTNRVLLPRTERAPTDRRVAHGTHVLDLAAGASPWGEDPMQAVPLLAVQLPPSAIRETAGRRMEAYLVQGLRWILAEALRQSDGTKVPPVVINLSVGSLAGPGDETAFLADWFRHEIARHARLTGGEVRLVIAYGNARLARLVARGELRRSTPMVLHWRVLPDDHSSSFLEVRVDKGLTDGLRLLLKPPPGSGLPELEVPWPEAGTGWRLADQDAGPLAAVTGVDEPGEQALLHLALGPTVGLGALPAAPPGAWQVELRTTKAEPVMVTARVQRDDTPPGHRSLGRQSWLDHPQGWDWDDEARAYIAPRPLTDAPGCPVTRQGSGVAYAGVRDPRVLFVGSVRPQTGAPDAVTPKAYSAEGVQHLARPGESRGPTLVARGDDGAALPGRRAAGVLSGSVARLSGTSMAAPLVARALAQYFLKTPEAERDPMAERRFLTGHDQWDVPDPRLGHGPLIAS
jgi:subtilisin family serine protease